MTGYSLRMPSRPLLALPSTLVLALTAFVAAGCAPTVDCTNLCQRTLACNVTFQPSDDPDEEMVSSGERSALESCARGCLESPLVNLESATCVDGVDVRDDACQDPVLACLGADGSGG